MNLGSLEGAVLPILGAVIAGGVIGFEREWRGRAAGLRTHILVSLASVSYTHLTLPTKRIV